jgi:hypothetical protein
MAVAVPVLVAVLAAAALHAGWNTLAKRPVAAAAILEKGETVRIEAAGHPG